MAQRSQSSIEFVVKPRENLSLEGSVRTLPRVSKGEQYPCQMQKNQNFSCLFRHYAKHNGLKKEDLVFYFVDELQPEQTPESVHLMPYDEIWVEHRKTAKKCNPTISPQTVIPQHLDKLLQSGEHTDITFIIGIDREEISGHKAILSARSEYFRAMFRSGSMAESSGTSVPISNHPFAAFRRMLEFLYTESVKDISSCSSSDVIQLIMLANEYLIEDLKSLCESHAAHSLTDDNVGKMITFCDKYGASELRQSCQDYILNNISTLRIHPGFRQEVADSPEVALLLVDVLPELDCKRRRLNTSPDSESSLLSLMPLHSPIDATPSANEQQQQSSVITIWPSTVMNSDTW